MFLYSDLDREFQYGSCVRAAYRRASISRLTLPSLPILVGWWRLKVDVPVFHTLITHEMIDGLDMNLAGVLLSWSITPYP